MAGEWQTTQFGNLLAEPVRNGIYKPKEFHGRGSKIVNMGELFAHPRLRSVPMKRVQLSEVEGDRFNVQKGDLLFARRSLVAEGAGKCSIVLDVDEPTVFESSIIRARPNQSKVDSLFMFYFFSSIAGLHALDTIRRQVAVSGITGSDLVRLEVPAPPVNEQRVIAFILGSLDDKIELNRRMNQTLEAMAQAIFKSWFVDFDPVRSKAEGRNPGLPKHVSDLFPDTFEDSELGEIPKGWNVRSIYEIADVVYGAPFASTHFNTEGLGELLIRIRDLANETPGVWTTETHPKGYKIKPGDIIVGMDGEFRSYLWGSAEAWINQRLCVFVPKGGYSAAFVRNSIIDPLAYVEATETGTTVIHLGKSDIDRFSALVPPDMILSVFNRVGQPLYDRIVAAKRESATVRTLRDTLLPKLISGELGVKQAEKLVGEAL